mgnify:CR=1 FL=1
MFGGGALTKLFLHRGDLNFRTKFDGEGKHTDHVKRALQFIDLKDYGALYAYDELCEGLKKGELLVGFETPDCDFPPTFKVQREAGFVYKEQRTPSYTDRILFKSFEGLEEHLETLAYEPCEDFITSDHKPVRGAFSISPNALIGAPMTDIDINLVFCDLQCSGLPAADSNGYSDPYLMFLWDSVEFTSGGGKSSFKGKIRKILVGKSWPRTKSLSKTLDPVWTETVELSAKAATVRANAMLFVVAMDADLVAIKDDFLGATAISVQELISMKSGRQTRKVVEFDRELQSGGVGAGRIKFTVDVDVTRKVIKSQRGASTVRRQSFMPPSGF